MSPHRPSDQRRRSLSVSPSIYHNHLCIDSCHKRTLSRKNLPRQWDLNSWRHEKRPRTHHTPVCANVCSPSGALLIVILSLFLLLQSHPRGWPQQVSLQLPVSLPLLPPSILNRATLVHHLLNLFESQILILRWLIKMFRPSILMHFRNFIGTSRMPRKVLCSVCAIGSYLAHKPHDRPIGLVLPSLHTSPLADAKLLPEHRANQRSIRRKTILALMMRMTC